jgi:DNA-binding XRE family transcriptional regulator
VDKRLKHFDPQASAELRAQLYAGVANGALSVGQAVKAMRKISRMTQPEFAAHRGISVQALRQIESDTGNPTVETLNKVASIFSLQVGFVPIRRNR